MGLKGVNRMGEDDRARLRAAHEAEMSEPAEDDALSLKLVTGDQIRRIRDKYATLCAEYAACKGIYISYRKAGFEEKAGSFATGAAVAVENARAVGEILDILGIDHTKL